MHEEGLALVEIYPLNVITSLVVHMHTIYFTHLGGEEKGVLKTPFNTNS